MDLIKRLCSHSASSISKKKKMPVPPLLNLPVELIFQITESLPPPDVAVLSETCHAMRNTLGGCRSAVHLARTDYFKYLLAKSRAFPGTWACLDCMTLHEYVKSDVPTARYVCLTSCPNHLNGSTGRGTRFNNHQIRLENHHVQLALKLARTVELSQIPYLRALMRPYHDTYTTFTREHGLAPIRVEYSAYPMLIRGDDGNARFLLVSTWDFHGYEQMRLSDFPRSLLICPHLCFDNFGLRGNILLETLPVLHSRRLLQNPRGAPSQVNGACSCCATEFCVTLNTSYCLTLSVWQDLGSESSPVDLTWRSTSRRNNGGALLVPVCPVLPVYNRPGTIKGLYECIDRIWRF